MKLQVLLPSIALIIISILSKIPSAECSKNEKCMWNSRDCICSNFYHTHQLLNVSLKRKIDNIPIIIRRMTTEKRARAIVMLQHGVGRRKVNHLTRNFLQIQVYDKTNWPHRFQVASHFGRRYSTIGGLCRRAT